MRPEKRYLVDEALNRIAASDYILLVNFTGVTVEAAAELRKVLAEVGAEYHVVKNSILNIVAKERKLPDLGDFLAGPTAVISGGEESSAVAKVVVKFFETREKASVKAGVIDGELADKAKVEAISKLPGLKEIRSQLLSLMLEPATGFVRVLVAAHKDELEALKAQA